MQNKHANVRFDTLREWSDNAADLAQIARENPSDADEEIYHRLKNLAVDIRNALPEAERMIPSKPRNAPFGFLPAENGEPYEPGRD